MRRAVVRRLVGLTVALGCGVAAVAAGSVEAPRPLVVGSVVTSPTDSPSPAATPPSGTSAPDASGRAAAPSASGATPQPTPTSRRSGTPAGTASGQAVRRDGPGLSSPGIHLAAQPDAAGVLEVVERVRTTRPVSTVTLLLRRPPAVPGLSGVAPTVVQLQAQGGDQPVSAPTALAAGRPVQLTLPAPTKDVALRYRLQSAAARSNPAPIGRVLTVLAPLTSIASTAPVVVDVGGAGVRNLVCPQAPAAQQVCGRRSGATWTAGPLRAATATVVAQVDLPGPGAR